MRDEIAEVVNRTMPPVISVRNHGEDIADAILALPVEGLVVEEKCISCCGKKTIEVVNPHTTHSMGWHECNGCHGTGTVTRPLTVGEAMALLRDNVTLSKITMWTLPNGGRVRVK